MSLQTKFVLLLVLLGLAVVGSLGAAKWSFDMLNRSVGQPFASTMAVLQSLGQIKRGVEEQSALLRGEPRMLAGVPTDEGAPAAPDAMDRPPPGAPPESATVIESFGNLAAGIRMRLDALAANDFYIARVGRSTSRNLEERLQHASRLGQEALAHDRPDLRADATAALFELHELIEAIELRILETSSISSEHQNWIQRRLLVFLVVAFLGAALVGVLAFMFVRRWVMRPVADIRVAAAKIAAGDFDHRLPVVGADELAQLSDEVNHMAAMVRTMQDERIERERLAAVGEMVRRLAHNLRNPLAGIRGLAEVTRADLPRTGEGADLRENQDRIIAAVDRFERWLKELLGATSPLSVHPEPTAVRGWLEGLVDAHRPAADLKGVRIDLDAAAAPEQAVFDPRHLEQALVALITNAVDASPAGGTVLVRVGEDAGQWQISVSDQGPGIPPELLEKIFKPYFTTKRDGNGIGLAVALQVVRAHGGRITVEPGLGPSGGPAGAGPGTSFRATMPRERASDHSERAAAGLSGATGGQDSRHRGRTEPAVRDQADADQVRS